MSDKRIVDLPLLESLDGSEKIPTGGRGDFTTNIDQIIDYLKSKGFNKNHGDFVVDLTEENDKKIFKLDLSDFYSTRFILNDQINGENIDLVKVYWEAFNNKSFGDFKATIELKSGRDPSYITPINSNIFISTVPDDSHTKISKLHIQYYNAKNYDEVVVSFAIDLSSDVPTDPTEPAKPSIDCVSNSQNQATFTLKEMRT